MVELNKNNYFSTEAMQKYMSVSMLKNFLECEFSAMGKTSGDYTENEKSESLMQGSLFHAWNEGNLSEFIEQNKEVLTSKRGGKMYAAYENVLHIINHIEKDKKRYENFHKALMGRKEVIFTAKLFDVDWKIMIDSYYPERGRFADLKLMKSVSDKFWDEEVKGKVGFIQNYKYDWQMSIYAEVERIANNRETHLEPYLVVATKENPPNTIVYKGFKDKIDDERTYIDFNLERIQPLMERIIGLREQRIKPDRCGNCYWCRKNNTTKIVHFSMV